MFDDCPKWYPPFCGINHKLGHIKQPTYQFDRKLMKPPDQIDGANVVEWAWSDSPFGEVGGIQIHGLAICRYADALEIYRFSCDAKWGPQQDQLYDSITEAKQELPIQYQNAKAVWHAT